MLQGERAAVGDFITDFGFLEWNTGHLTDAAMRDFALLLVDANGTILHMGNIFKDLGKAAIHTIARRSCVVGVSSVFMRLHPRFISQLLFGATLNKIK